LTSVVKILMMKK